jgi:hypothetical protein
MAVVLDPVAPQWAKTFKLSLDDEINRVVRPQSPVRTASYANVAALPDPAKWPNSIATCLDVGGSVKALVWSNGTNWFAVTTGAAL